MIVDVEKLKCKSIKDFEEFRKDLHVGKPATYEHILQQICFINHFTDPLIYQHLITRGHE
jgi:hypothetical protein